MRSVKKESRLKDRSRVAQFDVASFIQKPDGVEHSVPFGFDKSVEKRRKTSKDYDDGSDVSSGALKMRREDSEDLANFDIDNTPELNDNALPKDIINGKQVKLAGYDDQLLKYQQNERNRQGLLDNSFAHNLEKKCSFKNMKFPFFSRKSQNDKKEKKRKLFCFNCSKKDEGLQITTSTGVGKSAAAILAEKNSLKRSSKERSGSNRLAEKRQIPKQEIHNSREYYQQQIHNLELANTNINVPGNKNKEEVNTDIFFVSSPSEEDLQEDFSESPVEFREKRSEEDNDRRLKLLDEIQRKVDNVEIRVPSYPKMPYEPN
ncbi:hypothetical protein K1T71_008497 [Dendrolimus kikuchii]|uniref:Uncharacterized protein n=1 Tax=Dendrolimus kikuchii TaxID=765133 RepID=A0ACC1CYA5_9NEOP|nr:hypothetical protein K1T71_008497 [Dendrolimus kikuchii]